MMDVEGHIGLRNRVLLSGLTAPNRVSLAVTNGKHEFLRLLQNGGLIDSPRRAHTMSSRPRFSQGFTMLELGIALVIVGLLVAVAVASYRESQAQKYRYEALKAMTELSQALHQHYAAARSFQGAKLAYNQSPKDGAARYRISLAAAPVQSTDPGVAFQATSDLGFTLQATPTHDDACGVLLLDQTGRRGVTAGKVADCWR